MEMLSWATRGGPHVITGVLTGGPREGQARGHDGSRETEGSVDAESPAGICGQPLAAGEGNKAHPPLEPPDGVSALGLRLPNPCAHRREIF